MKKINDNEIAFYKSADGRVNIEVMHDADNIWLSQRKIAELFNTTSQNITQHIKNIYLDKEVSEVSTCKDFLQVQVEGERKVTRNTTCYSLELVIAVGYRVNSERGAEFRAWATSILKSYIQKGYALDSDRMKFGSRFSSRYFDDLYEEIKDIRTSERRIYQKITDIYATAIDYSSTAYESKQFFATVQNKLHFAITGKTAAEIVVDRVNCEKNKMGLTSWRKSPEGKIMPSDVVVAKNYLDKKELEDLNRIGNMYLDYAELQTARGVAMSMSDWIEKLNTFLNFTEYEILTNAGKISHEVAEALALGEYEKYKVEQDKNYISDFDREVKNILENKSSEK
jgi:hypothetical protein